jgi:thioredoxin 1
MLRMAQERHHAVPDCFSMMEPVELPTSANAAASPVSYLTAKTSVGYDAVSNSYVIIPMTKEGVDVAGETLKVEDGTWDAEVMKATELVMVDFWAVWCGPCQMVAPIIDELAKEYAGKLKVRKLNTDENPEVAGRYQVMSIPTILFFKNGQPVEKLVGARPKRQFKELIDSLLAQHAGTA